MTLAPHEQLPDHDLGLLLALGVDTAIKSRNVLRMFLFARP